jgi:hypothetical protein
MCATVCPSQALFFGTRKQIDELRPQSTPNNRFRFGEQDITTRVQMMVPARGRPEHLDVMSAMDGEESDGSGTEDMMLAAIQWDE